MHVCYFSPGCSLVVVVVGRVRRPSIWLELAAFILKYMLSSLLLLFCIALPVWCGNVTLVVGLACPGALPELFVLSTASKTGGVG